MLEFDERTISISIDTSLCEQCKTKACVKACKIYGRNILQLKDDKPDVSHLSNEEIKRLGTECLACEYECWFRGRSAIKIEVPIENIELLVKK